MTPQILLPQKPLPADVAMIIPLTDMLYQVRLQQQLIEEPLSADVTLEIFLLQMQASHVVPQMGVNGKYPVAMYTLMAGAVSFNCVFL